MESLKMRKRRISGHQLFSSTLYMQRRAVKMKGKTLVSISTIDKIKCHRLFFVFFFLYLFILSPDKDSKTQVIESQSFDLYKIQTFTRASVIMEPVLARLVRCLCKFSSSPLFFYFWRISITQWVIQRCSIDRFQQAFRMLIAKYYVHIAAQY